MLSRRPPGSAHGPATSSSMPTAPALTVEGRRLLEARIRLLQDAAADLGDALHDSEGRADAVEEYRRTTLELVRLQAIIESAAMLDDALDDPRRVDLGDHVLIRLDDATEETYVIVHGAEAAVDDARISAGSPLGQALLGREVGETVAIAVPAGSYRCEILRATRRGPQGGAGR